MTYICIDTNAIYVPNPDIEHFSVPRSFYELHDCILNDQIEDDTVILIPDLVIRERYEQIYESLLEKNKNDSEKHKEIYPYEYYRYDLYTITEDFFGQLKNVIRIPVCNNMYFNDILEWAIKKHAPFERTDKGFKDAVIYFSMFEYAKQNPGKYYLVTNDNRLNDISLKSHFKIETGLELKIFRKFERVINEIRRIDVREVIRRVGIEYEIQTETRGDSVREISMDFETIKPFIPDSAEQFRRINDDINGLFEQCEFEWNEIELKDRPLGENMRYLGKMEGEIKYNDCGKLSILFKEERYTGGVHGGRILTGRVYDLNTGRKIKLSSLLQKSEKETIAQVMDSVQKDKEENKGKYFEFFSPEIRVEEEINYYLADDGVHIFYNEYEAACYAVGVIDLLIQKRDLEDRC